MSSLVRFVLDYRKRGLTLSVLYFKHERTTGTDFKVLACSFNGELLFIDIHRGELFQPLSIRRPSVSCVNRCSY